MNNNEPNKIVSKLWKQFNELRCVSDSAKYDYNRESELKAELLKIATVSGSIEVMSKNSIIKLCAMESIWRFMALHSFGILFSKTAEDMSL